jgi:hypothetical protein
MGRANRCALPLNVWDISQIDDLKPRPAGQSKQEQRSQVRHGCSRLRSEISNIAHSGPRARTSPKPKKLRHHPRYQHQIQPFPLTAAPRWCQRRTAARNREDNYAPRQPDHPTPRRDQSTRAPNPAKPRQCAPSCAPAQNEPNFLLCVSAPLRPISPTRPPRAGPIRTHPAPLRLRCNQMQPNATFFEKCKISSAYLNAPRCAPGAPAQNEPNRCPKKSRMSQIQRSARPGGARRRERRISLRGRRRYRAGLSSQFALTGIFPTEIGAEHERFGHP